MRPRVLRSPPKFPDSHFDIILGGFSSGTHDLRRCNAYIGRLEDVGYTLWLQSGKRRERYHTQYLGKQS